MFMVRLGFFTGGVSKGFSEQVSGKAKQEH